MRILLIEDDEVDQLAFERMMKKQPYEYVIAKNLTEGKKILSTENIDLVVSDYQLPDGTGMEILSMNLPIPVIITTGTGTENIAVQSMKAGASDYIIKDIDRTYLLLLPTILEKALIQKKNSQMLQTLGHTLRSISEGVCIVDAADQIIFINSAFCQLFGYHEKELLDQPKSILFGQLRGSISNIASEEGLMAEFTYTHPDGGTFPCMVSRSNVLDEKGQRIATVAIFKDISKHVAVEEKLRKKAEELAHIRAELNQMELFSFVSTHDLQEPLHKIITFGNLFMSDSSLILNESGRFYLNNIVNSVEEMRQMISQIHHYAKIMTEGIQISPLDLNQVIGDVQSKLAEQIQSLNAKFHINTLPTINGDKRQIYKLFLNLIHNALTFHRESIPPEITILCTETDERILIEIIDNGIGFDEKYLPRLFKPFQRLHTSKEYPGRGLGLAICKKILERHSGDIKAKSTLGKGSTFTVTLPKFLENS